MASTPDIEDGDRRVRAHHVDAVTTWLREQPWHPRFMFYLVGSMVEGGPGGDLDLATHPRDDDPPSWAVVDRMLRELRAYGRVFHQIPIDASYAPDTQARITQLAHDGRPFAVYKLGDGVLGRRMRAGDTAVTRAPHSLVRVERRLVDTAYYGKLPTGVWRGRRQRVLRPARLLVGPRDPSGPPSKG